MHCSGAKSDPTKDLKQPRQFFALNQRYVASQTKLLWKIRCFQRSELVCATENNLSQLSWIRAFVSYYVLFQTVMLHSLLVMKYQLLDLKKTYIDFFSGL